MKGMVELHDMEKQYDITTWLADTMRMVVYFDPSAEKEDCNGRLDAENTGRGAGERVPL